ncbi:MAG: hypothetical protein IPJ30_27545 [Acidobacteria bacterium]|nr:hypothetical protein [Acidobacteriota bacterium]
MRFSIFDSRFQISIPDSRNSRFQKFQIPDSRNSRIQIPDSRFQDCGKCRVQSAECGVRSATDLD